MAAKPKATETEKSETPEGVLTVSQFEILTEAEKNAFREANGTVTNDPT